jgi:CO dehydrogenase maturation factor
VAYTIAISGKGGVGKSTIAALVVRFLSEDVGRSVLAVDGDPNATLGALLGLQVAATVADIREETLEKKDNIPSGMSKDRFVEYRIQQAIVEHPGFDLLTMGRPEGPGCYCFVNSLLRGYLDKASRDYPYVVMDTEAGMEHLSRRTTTGVDLLVVVTEPSVVGAETAGRIAGLVKTLPIAVRRSALLVNRVPPEGISPTVRSRLDAIGLPILGQVPYDEAIVAAASDGESLLELPKDNTMFATVRDILSRELDTAKLKRGT